MWRRRREREIDKELRFHIECQVDENLRAGMPPAEARRQALLAFGGPTQIHEECRELLPFRWMGALWADVHYAVRTLRASPAFTLTAVLSIALGIGANAAIFTLLHAALWKPLPVSRPGELFHLVRSDGAEDRSYSWPLYEELRDAAAPYGKMFARGSVEPRRFSAGAAAGETVIGETISGEYFVALEIRPAAGRLLDPSDDRSPQPAIVLSYSFWVRRFQADPSIVGKIVQYDEMPFRVIGVAEEGFRGVDAGIATDVWAPVKILEKKFVADGGSSSWLAAIVRAKNPAAAQGAIEARFRRHVAEELLPGETTDGRLRSLKAQHIRLRPAASGFGTEGRPYQRALNLLMGIVTVVLLIACANVAGLLLARNVSRRREIAVRVALGAGRARLASQLLSESLMLALAGTAAGLAMGFGGRRWLIQLLPPASRVPLEFDLTPDRTVLAFAALLAIVTTLLCGVGPVWRAWRSGADVLRSGSPRVTDRAFGRKILAAGQLALSLILVSGAGLFLKNLYRLAETDLGFRPEHVMAFEISFPRATSQERRAQVARAVLENLAARPGITATYTSPGIYEHGGWSMGLRLVDGKTPARGSDTEVQALGVGPAFFETLGIRLLAGRTLNARDDRSRAPVAVVNESFARKYFAGASPIGHVFVRWGQNVAPTEIVGVARDVKHMGVKERVWPAVYLPALQLDGLEGTLLVRASLSPAQATNLVRGDLKRADATAQIESSEALETGVTSMISRERLIAYVSAAFGALAALLASVGLYGVVAYSMSRRTSEIGIRMALGARPSEIRRMALSESLRLTAAGMLVGIPGALAVGKLARGLLTGMSTADPWVLGAAALLLIAAGLAAGWIPASRAARVDPNSALRQG